MSGSQAPRLLPLVFVRPGKPRLARWEEIDFEARIWTVPAARAKMRRPNRVPLSRQAIEILADDLDVIGETSDLLFPSARSDERAISDNTLNAAVRRLGYGKSQMTAHGFRPTASTLLNESGKWHPNAIEHQLAQVESNDVRRAYIRGKHWDERVAMMQWWSDYLDQLRRSGNRSLIRRSPMTSRPVRDAFDPGRPKRPNGRSRARREFGQPIRDVR